MSAQIIKHGTKWLGRALFECSECGCRFIEDDVRNYFVGATDNTKTVQDAFLLRAWCPECNGPANYLGSLMNKDDFPNTSILDDYYAEQAPEKERKK